MSKVLKIDQGDYIVQVKDGRIVFENDLYVKGEPYGTAPIVSNVLYVTMDGSDSNNGSAMDPTRACRTISGAVKSPLYQPGTTIRVSPGRYYENNPIVVKPYTSIIGSDLRTTAVEPINKTQDLFHVNSSTYIANIQMYNGRSGIVDPFLDRGAYAVTFPINYGFLFEGQTYVANVDNKNKITNISKNDIEKIVLGMEILNATESTYDMINTGARVTAIIISTEDPDNNAIELSNVLKDSTIPGEPAKFRTGKITVYKSPYVQNCTNQSGPWLYDGTMYVPNQTVHIPLAVGTTTFEANETTIQVEFSEMPDNYLDLKGMSINTAPQHQGFFSARTLILSNMRFIQEQVIKYIEDTYITGQSEPFQYDDEKCRRDIKIILEHVLYDVTFGGNSKSIQSGSAYWQGAVSLISGEVTQTISALDYIVNSLFGEIVQNQLADDLYQTNIVTAGNFKVGEYYTIVDPGTDPTLFKEAGAIPVGTAYPVGLEFLATAAGVGDGTAKLGKVQEINLALTDGIISIEPFTHCIDIIKNIVLNGLSAVPANIFYSTGPEPGLASAEILLQQNRLNIQQSAVAYISGSYPAAVLNLESCKRDVGYIVDAISQDVLLGGNARTIEGAITYFVAKKNILTQQELAICVNTYAAMTAWMIAIVKNESVLTNQFIDLNLRNGEITEETITRNMGILTSIVQGGLSYAPPKYSGTALFSATGVSADDVQQSTKVIDIQPVPATTSTYSIILDNPTYGVGNNSTLYFGYTSVYPVVESTIPDRWANRKIDPWGSMGGMLIDGDAVTELSPIRSFVADAFTQVNQGGRGIRVTNRGYVQLVSVFTIFSSISVQVDKGGIASVTNSNANFGKYCMISKGYGPREFSGTIYNPANFKYDSINSEFVQDEYYPSGFFPYNQNICVFIPDLAYRPHISLMMEVLPPTDYINARGKPGFLTATITLSTIKEGDLYISGIITSSMYIGQKVYIYDQFGSYEDPTTQQPYILEDTYITDMSPQTIYLSKPINISGGDINNPSYFTLFTAGNAYYTILSSTPASNPSLHSDGSEIVNGDLVIPDDQIISTNPADRPELQAIAYLQTVLEAVVAKTPASVYQTEVEQVFLPIYDIAPVDAADKLNALLTNINVILENNVIVTEDLQLGLSLDTILTTLNITLTKTGTVIPSDGDISTMILANLDFIVAEVSAFVEDQISSADPINEPNWYLLSYNSTKCKRDIRLICVNLSYDLLSGGNYNSVYSGLSYYSRPGTYHIVEIEDSVRNNLLFPDGAIVNFYQRSYISASGYLFEYIGSGIDYSALPQVGRVDPIQENEVNMLDGGKVFFTSTDQNGDFRIGPDLVISQATGVLSGRTFQKSLFAEMTPFILAIEG